MTRFIAPIMVLCAVALALVVVSPRPATALTAEERLVEEARLAFESIRADGIDYFEDAVGNARAIIIIPNLVRGGFLFGGEGGSGVMLARLADGTWSYPAFFDIGGGSVGLQIGGQVSETVLAVMTDEAVQAVLNRSFTVGADLSAAVVNVGRGLDARTGLDLNAPMYAFSLTRGLFIGGALEGSLLLSADRRNQVYYLPGATADGILAGQYTNAQANPLRATLP